jgi:hypothetical protein
MLWSGHQNTPSRRTRQLFVHITSVDKQEAYPETAGFIGRMLHPGTASTASESDLVQLKDQIKPRGFLLKACKSIT